MTRNLVAKRSVRAIAGLVVVSACLVPASVKADAVPALARIGASARWSGAVSNATAPHPAACVEVTCRSYLLDVSVRSDHRTDIGLLVSLRWPTEQLDLGYDLDLYLYGPGDELVGKSNTVGYSVAEALWLQRPASGRYRIVVAPRDVAGTSPFDVFASLARGWSVSTTSSVLGAADAAADLSPHVSTLTFLGERPPTTEQMLPDLVALTPSNFHIESTAAASFYVASERVPAHQPSCYPQEITGATADEPGSQQPVLRCLRWDMTVSNVGRGPLEIRAYPESETPTDAFQAVYRSDGSYVLEKVGDAKFSSAHGHVHVRGMDEAGLYTIDADGSPGRRVGALPEKGFCPLDLIDASFGTRADGPSRYVYPSTCDAETNRDPRDPLYPNEQYFRMGISSGWADIYPWLIPDQYIDITNVPDGRYLIVYRVNAAERIMEATDRNNTASTCVEFHDTTVSAC